ncbi:MAG: dihydrolipoamide acetyltransferase family protein [Spirochaetota bacterium]
MATEVLMPKQGNTVESCLIVEWKKKEGDAVAEKEVICVVETDKATFEIESPAAGTMLKQFFATGDDVPVQTIIAAIGKAGEDVSAMTPNGGASDVKAESAPAPKIESTPAPSPAKVETPSSAPAGDVGVSPRARNLADAKGIAAGTLGGTGPGGRIIERDVKAALSGVPTPAAVAAAKASGMGYPLTGSGIGGRVRAGDLTGRRVQGNISSLPFPGAFTDTPVKGIRKLISERMLTSMTTTAQCTLSSSADASVMLSIRERLKKLPKDDPLSSVTINDFVLFAVARTLTSFRMMNAHFSGTSIREFEAVHLAFAVDTPRGLMVPVIKNAHARSLIDISAEAKRLGKACQDGSAKPDELSGSTFTITNLGALGIESFTPVLNIPEVAILGVCSTVIRPMMKDGALTAVPYMGLSITFNHQAVDGAPTARFLKAVADTLASFDILMLG